MNCDRFGYFDNGYHYWPAIVRSGDFYGFDPDDSVYRDRIPYEKGRENCPVCGIHDIRERRYPCDVMIAQARDIEAAGYPATFCRSCSSAMPVRDGQDWSWSAKCWFCERAEKRRRPRKRGYGGTYIDDGIGCVEKVPSWMADWDGDPTAGGGIRF